MSYRSTFNGFASLMIGVPTFFGCAGNLAGPEAKQALPQEGLVRASPKPESPPSPTDYAADTWGMPESIARVPGSAAAKASDVRLRVYQARVDLLVPNVEESIARFTTLVEQSGGYVDSRTNGDLQTRVPVVAYRDVLAQVKQSGRVTFFSESSQDVTNDRGEIAMKLENANKSRERLFEVLAKATATTDILAIEADINRLTNDIQRFEGQLRAIDLDVAYSRIEAIFSANAPEGPGSTSQSGLFPWFDSIGVESMLKRTDRNDVAEPGFFEFLVPTRHPPLGFVQVASSEKYEEFAAVAADRSVFRSRRIPASRDGDLGFWVDALRTDFVSRRGDTLIDEKKTTRGSLPAVEFTLERTVQGQAYRCLVTLSVEKRWFSADVLVDEFVATKERFESHLAGVRAFDAN